MRQFNDNIDPDIMITSQEQYVEACLRYVASDARSAWRKTRCGPLGQDEYESVGMLHVVEVWNRFVLGLCGWPKKQVALASAVKRWRCGFANRTRDALRAHRRRRGNLRERPMPVPWDTDECCACPVTQGYVVESVDVAMTMRALSEGLPYFERKVLDAVLGHNAGRRGPTNYLGVPEITTAEVMRCLPRGVRRATKLRVSAALTEVKDRILCTLRG